MFQPSKLSLTQYGQATIDDLVAAGPTVEAVDPLGGRFAVGQSDIKYLGGGPANYPAPGTTWTKAKDGTTFDTMIGNLATSAGGKYRSAIEGVVGKSATSSYIETAKATSGSLAYSADTGEKTKDKGALSGTRITDKPWFWPTAIISSAVLVGGIITVIVVRRRKSSEEQ